MLLSELYDKEFNFSHLQSNQALFYFPLSGVYFKNNMDINLGICHVSPSES